MILQKGFLRDLTPLIQESGFSLEDYPSNLMDVGVYQGERLLLPFWFAPDFLISSKATEEKYGLELRGQMTCDQFLEACRPAAEDGLPLIGTYLPFSTYLQAINLPIADYEQKKPLVNTPEFREACEFYQSFYPQMAEYLDREGESYQANAFDRLCKGQALFTLDLYGVERPLIQFDAILRQETGQGISAYPFPSPVENDAKYALTNAAVGVSETCRLPEEAFDYIVEFLNVWKYGLGTIHKDFIGYEFTKTAASIEAGNTLPAQVYNYTAPITQVPEELQSWYVEYLNSAIGVFQEFNIYDFLDEMYPYFEGKASYEECLETLENQLNLYLNE